MISTMTPEFRRTFIGGSDAAAILGVSPWNSELDVWMKKTGLDTEPLTGDHIDMGHYHEPTVAKIYTDKTGRELFEPEFRVHPKYQHVGAHPDRIVIDGDRILEIKTTNWRNADEWGVEHTDEVPAHYLCQGIVYMEVFDIDVIDYAVMIDGGMPKMYTVHRNKAFGDKICSNLNQWYIDHVIDGKPPQASTGAEALRLVNLSYKQNKAPLKKLDAELSSMVCDRLQNLIDLKEEAKDLEGRIKRIESELKEVIGDAEGIEANGLTVTWKNNKESVRIDWESVAAELDAPIALIKKHTTVKTGARVLRLPRSV